MSIKLECHSKWNGIKNGMSLTFIYLKCNEILNEISLKLECPSKWNVNQIWHHSNWKTKLIRKVVNPKTSKSASLGWLAILLIEGWKRMQTGTNIILPYTAWYSEKETYFSVCYPIFLESGENEIERLGPSQKWAFH